MTSNSSALAERIADRLIELRTDRCWSLQEVADRAALSRNYLWELERGRCNPSAATIVRLCRAYSVSADWLLGIGEEL